MDKSGEGEDQRAFLFQHLVAMFQTLALQQLGKLANPLTGKMERDLLQARITIDMVQMLKEKTSGNLSDMEQRLVDKSLMELQMNYIDEERREAVAAEKEEAEGGEPVAEEAEKAEPKKKIRKRGRTGGRGRSKKSSEKGNDE